MYNFLQFIVCICLLNSIPIAWPPPQVPSIVFGLHFPWNSIFFVEFQLVAVTKCITSTAFESHQTENDYIFLHSFPFFFHKNSNNFFPILLLSKEEALLRLLLVWKRETALPFMKTIWKNFICYLFIYLHLAFQKNT